MQIKIDDLSGTEIAKLLTAHLFDMHATSPPESVHALNLDGLRKPEITFWTLWEGSNLAGCGALKQLDTTHGEIKSMRTANHYRQRGVASQLLHHIVNTAQNRGYHRLSLETGSKAYFAGARQLYAKFGFRECGPFSDYTLDPNSVFMTLIL